MAAKNWESDFRYPAIQTSLQWFTGDLPDDIYTVPHSFCLPVASRPVVGFTPGKLNLLLLVAGFALLFLALWILPNDRDKDANDSLRLAIGSLCGLSGMGCFFVPALFSSWIATWFVGSRARELRDFAGGARLQSAELGNGDLSLQKIEIDGDDYVLIYMDARNRRLIIEGIAARYQIRGQDVRFVQPFIFQNYIGAQICCRMDAQTELLFAIARVSLLYELTRQLPFLSFMQKRIRNQIYDEASRTLMGPLA